MLVSENLLLRQQLIVLSRRHPRSPQLNAWDRLLAGFFSASITASRIHKVAIIFKPSTVLKFHKLLVDRKYSKLFRAARAKPGPKGPSQELMDAIVAMKQRNPRMGCPQIAGHISHSFGIEINKDTVRRILAKHYHGSPSNNDGSGPSWLTFLAHSQDSLWSLDFFRCESAHLKSYAVMVVMDVFSRRIIGFAAEPYPLDGAAVCRMFNRATAQNPKPQYLSTDNDPLFQYHRWLANLDIFDVNEIKTVPYAPVSHPFVERLIGTVRRECLDQMLFWNGRDLERKLNAFKDYYNVFRVHSSLDLQTPAEKCGSTPPCAAQLTRFSWQQHCQGLFQTPICI